MKPSVGHVHATPSRRVWRKMSSGRRPRPPPRPPKPRPRPPPRPLPPPLPCWEKCGDLGSVKCGGEPASSTTSAWPHRMIETRPLPVRSSSGSRQCRLTLDVPCLKPAWKFQAPHAIDALCPQNCVCSMAWRLTTLSAIIHNVILVDFHGF